MRHPSLDASRAARPNPLRSGPRAPASTGDFCLQCVAEGRVSPGAEVQSPGAEMQSGGAEIVQYAPHEQLWEAPPVVRVRVRVRVRARVRPRVS